MFKGETKKINSPRERGACDVTPCLRGQGRDVTTSGDAAHVYSHEVLVASKLKRSYRDSRLRFLRQLTALLTLFVRGGSPVSAYPNNRARKNGSSTRQKPSVDSDPVLEGPSTWSVLVCVILKLKIHNSSEVLFFN